MAKKKEQVAAAPRPNDNWVYTNEIQVNGRTVTKGTELKIDGERGRFRFIHVINTGSAEWVDVYGGPKGCDAIRSFRLDRIKTVHYKNKTDYNLAKEFKEKKKALKTS